MFCMVLLASTAVLFASIGLVRDPETTVISFASLMLLAFVAFMGWSIARVALLARRVLRLRQKLRDVASRQTRLSNGRRPRPSVVNVVASPGTLRTTGT